MYNFTIFNKKGIVQYSEGEVPVFLNDLVVSIDPRTLNGSRRVRDDIMEYQIVNQVVYMSISRKEILSKKVEEFEGVVSQLKENEMITPEMLEAHKAASLQQKASPENKPKREDKNIAEELDFSERSTTVQNVIEGVKRANIKRIFSLFSKKINIDELRGRMVEHLIKKNVEPSFSTIITDDVIAECKSAEKEVISEEEFKSRMAQTLGKLLPTMNSQGFIEKIKGHGIAYSICFVGVNGVGKTTSLAKVACWLIQNGLRVYIAACDTFRAGAIKQLKVHVDRFKVGGHEVGFYESGYSKDDSSVAKAAIMRATKENYDVILIDTAGRVHQKENLMQSLSKLIRINNPDHILFVGEALAGGDSLSHIKEFNKWISEGRPGRKIDSILLTKVDTVDDKIGQVVNLTFSASSPILFLGVGQSNSDLVPMDPVSISELLTS